MNDGYNIVEPPCLALLFGNPKCFDFAVLMLQWVASEANARCLAGAGVVEVIKVEYAGAYPALGIKGASLDDAESALSKLAEELLDTRTIPELLTYAAASNVHWRQMAISLLDARPESPPTIPCG
jgi:hypothetical protein